MVRLADCHPNRKMQARGMCKSCYDKWLKATNPVYKKNQASNTTKWAQANPEKWKAIQERRKKRDREDPKRWEQLRQRKRETTLLRMYGLTTQDYEQMQASQDNKCAICDRAPGDRPLHVDHCHTTNKVRGLLCHQCNWYLGTLEGGEDVLGRLIDYMATHKSPAFLLWRKHYD